MTDPREWDPLWVRQERLAQGLTIDQLAAKSALPSSTVCNAERPGHGLRIDLATRIVRDGLGLSLSELALRGAIYDETGVWPEVPAARALRGRITD